MNRFVFRFVLIGLALTLASAGIYQLPAVNERLDWRIAELRAEIKYALSPPEEAVFIPQEQAITPTPTVPTYGTATASPISATLAPTVSGPTATPIPSSTATETPTPLPESVLLKGIRHEYQTWNNCGPANLSMALSFWDWPGNQGDIQAVLRPNPRDKNVMPYEMADYIEEETNFNVIVRVGGDLELVKRLIAAGLPVVLEKGFEGTGFDGWMGHYVTVTGYDDLKQLFIVQDSFIMPDMAVSYEQIESFWRAFNYTYIVVYPPERESDVLAILGSNADETYNYEFAAEKASQEIFSLDNRDQFFAWFNRGSNLMALQDYGGAATPYDEAFAIYAALPEKERPWRMMWYQTGPYWAYFYSGRYHDVVNLATTTLDAMSEPVLEESYYWRALARQALGDNGGAIDDLQTSLKRHPGFEPSLLQLETME